MKNSILKIRIVLFCTIIFSSVITFTADAQQPAGIKNIVLVHGAFVDGSGWKPVYDILVKRGPR